MTATVRAQLIGTRYHRLFIFIDGVFVGEYERAQEADIARKTEEVQASEDQLLGLFKAHGLLKVRWSNKTREKIVYDAEGLRRGTIDRKAWRKPSWI